jgi:hypothetical protein
MKRAVNIKHTIRLYLLIQAFVYCFALEATAQSSSVLLENKISVHCTNQPLADILDELKRTHHLSFSYFNSQLPVGKKITLLFHNAPLYQILNSISKQADIQYQAIGGQIVLKENSKQQAKQKSLSNISKKPTPGKVLNITPDKNHLLLTSTHELTGSPLDANPTINSEKSSTRKSSNKQSEYTTRKGLPTTAIVNTKQLAVLQKKKIVEQISYLNNLYELRAFRETVPSLTYSIPFRLLPIDKSTYSAKQFQLALVPGISTHGIHPGEFINTFSVNLLAGYSAGNQLIEIGGLSNFNQQHVFGLQIGGIANVLGGNRFVSLSREEKLKLKKEKTEANLQGVQLSGLTNIVDGNVFGWQTTGGVNLVKKSLQGVQLGGISNLVSTFTFGIQLAGVSNASIESVDGMQLAGLYNYTEGELHGIQVSAFNQAGEIEGKRSLLSVHHTGLQIGLLNTARRMNGFQVGLINIGRQMAGTQIGLINLNADKHGKGIPIGLLNLNTKNEFLRLYTSELFASNLEISTGSLRIQNMLSVGYNPFTGTDFYRPTWSVGYSLGQIKRPQPSFFYSYDAGIAHINQGMKPTKQLSLLGKVRATAGYKLDLRKVVFHVFGGITFNTLLADGDHLPLSPDFLRIYDRQTDKSRIEIWPGFVAGIHL